jgi:quinol monooxygenase YgiN
MMSIRRRQAWFVPVAGLAGLVIAVAIMTASAARAQSGPDTVYALTTFDVSPSATLQTIALLKQYRNAARRQAGNISVDLLQETGLLNRFAIHESWSNRSAYDANEKAPQMTALRDGLKPLAGAPLDRRTYRPFSIGPTGNAASGGAVYMVLILDVFPPGLVPTLAAVKDAAAAARTGEGNLRYDVEQEGLGLGNHMIFYAAWQNRGDFDAYEKSDYARHLRDVVGPLLGSPYDDRLYALLD